MKSRIIFAYIGVLVLPAILLPYACIDTMGGHSLAFAIYCSVFGSPIGIIAGMLFSDIKRHFPFRSVLIRTLSSAFILFVGYLISDSVGAFKSHDFWLLILLVAPMAVSVPTEFVLRGTENSK